MIRGKAFRVAPFLFVVICSGAALASTAGPGPADDLRPVGSVADSDPRFAGPGADTRPTESPRADRGNWWDDAPETRPAGPRNADRDMNDRNGMDRRDVGRGANPPADENDRGLFDQTGRDSRGPYSNVTDYPGQEVRDWVVANAMAARARSIFRQAESELSAAVRRVQTSFEKSHANQDAVNAERIAYGDYLAARNRALASVVNDARYREITRLRDELGEKLARRRAARDVSKEEILAMATLKMQYASDARAMEVSALNADESLQRARERMMAASSRVRDLHRRFDDTFRDNPEVLEARRNLIDARIAMLEAQAYARAAGISSGQALSYSYYLHRNDNGGIYGPYGPNFTGGGYYSPYWRN